VALAAGAAVAGHNWPLWFKFSGGGGLATSAGVLSVFGLRETLIGLAVVLGFALLYKLPILYGKLPMAALPFGSLFGLPTMIWLFRRSDSFGGVVSATLCVILVGVRALGLNAEGKQRQAARSAANPS
jgi:glycerol-3-phosphate acyltransferase PlsY